MRSYGRDSAGCSYQDAEQRRFLEQGIVTSHPSEHKSLAGDPGRE